MSTKRQSPPAAGVGCGLESTGPALVHEEEPLEECELKPANRAFHAQVIAARDHFDLFLQHRIEEHLLGAFSAIRKAEALLPSARDELRGSGDPHLGAFRPLREKILCELTAYADSRLAASQPKPAVRAKTIASRIVRAAQDEYARLHYQQTQWLKEPARRSSRPPSGVAKQVLERVARRLDVTYINAWRAWSTGYLDEGPDERHIYRSLVDEVEAMHDRIQRLAKESLTDGEQRRRERPKLEFSRRGHP